MLSRFQVEVGTASDPHNPLWTLVSRDMRQEQGRGELVALYVGALGENAIQRYATFLSSTFCLFCGCSA